MIQGNIFGEERIEDVFISNYEINRKQELSWLESLLMLGLNKELNNLKARRTRSRNVVLAEDFWKNYAAFDWKADFSDYEICEGGYRRLSKGEESILDDFFAAWGKGWRIKSEAFPFLTPAKPINPSKALADLAKAYTQAYDNYDLSPEEIAAMEMRIERAKARMFA